VRKDVAHHEQPNEAESQETEAATAGVEDQDTQVELVSETVPNQDQAEHPVLRNPLVIPLFDTVTGE
jgi:hypothetical protein